MKKYDICMCNSNRGFSNRREEFEPVTKPDLAVTPAQALKMTQQGIPVSAMNASGMNDGVFNPSWDVSPVEERGMDAATIWNLQQDARARVSRGFKKLNESKTE